MTSVLQYLRHTYVVLVTKSVLTTGTVAPPRLDNVTRLSKYHVTSHRQLTLPLCVNVINIYRTSIVNLIVVVVVIDTTASNAIIFVVLSLIVFLILLLLLYLLSF